MRTSAFLTIANFGTAFAAVQMYGQCGGSAYSGDKECPSGSTCVEASKWYSQCIPDASSKKAPSVKKTDFGLPEFGFPGYQAPQAPAEGGNNQGGDNGLTQPPPDLSPAPEEPVDTPTIPALEESADVPSDAPVNTAIASLTVTPTSEPTDSGSGSGSAGITRTIPSSSGATAVATAIPVSGELDGGMTYYDRSRKSTDIKLSRLPN
jgi:hypothetical protein